MRTVVGMHPTVIATLELPVFPFESVADAVTVWLPSVKTLCSVAPVPRKPSLVEDQDRKAERFPSSSVAAPENVMLAPLEKVAPVFGLRIVTTGAKLMGPEPAPT